MRSRTRSLACALRWRARTIRRALAGGFELDDDPARIDVDAVHAFISEESYWARGRARETTVASIAGSHRVVGLYRESEQIGFARAISDGATFAYLADVYVLPSWRGRGLGVELVREIVEGDAGAGLRWVLNTADAQPLYEKTGFTGTPPRYPFMERRSSARRAGGEARG
jgi:GNAT superfamily N-acetyltransferase